MREYDFDACADHKHDWQVIGKNIFGGDISECSICGVRRTPPRETTPRDINEDPELRAKLDETLALFDFKEGCDG